MEFYATKLATYFPQVALQILKTMMKVVSI